MEKINGIYAVDNITKSGLRQDYTAKEAKRKNGPCITYDVSTFDKPTPYEIFTTWPDDIKRDYLKKCYWTYCCTMTEIADFMGAMPQRMYYLANELDLPLRKKGYKRTVGEKKKADAFIKGKTTIKETISEETEQKLKEIVSDEAKNELKSSNEEKIRKTEPVSTPEKQVSAVTKTETVITKEEPVTKHTFLKVAAVCVLAGFAFAAIRKEK